MSKLPERREMAAYLMLGPENGPAVTQPGNRSASTVFRERLLVLPEERRWIFNPCFLVQERPIHAKKDRCSNIRAAL